MSSKRAGVAVATIARQTNARNRIQDANDQDKGSGGGGGSKGTSALEVENSFVGLVFKRRMRAGATIDHEINDESDTSWTNRIPIVEVGRRTLVHGNAESVPVLL